MARLESSTIAVVQSRLHGASVVRRHAVRKQDALDLLLRLLHRRKSSQGQPPGDWQDRIRTGEALIMAQSCQPLQA